MLMGKEIMRNNKRRKGGMVKLKIVVEKLQKRLLLGGMMRKSSSSSSSSSEDGDVPEDVKEGHFAVIAAANIDDHDEDNNISEEEGTKRFVVPLRCLTHPSFLRLLEEAAQEYGFDQEGAITIPCRPSQLETILADQFNNNCHYHHHSHSHSNIYQ